MRLTDLIEQDYQMSPAAQERWGKVIDIQQPQQPSPQNDPQQQYAQQQQKKPRSQGKEYRMKFKDEVGGGEYKIKIRKTPDNETKYNYGHYNMTDAPDLSQIDQSKLTPKGLKVYAQIDAVLKNPSSQPQQTPQQEQPQQQVTAG